LGPNRDGIIRDKGLNLDWKTKVPPVLWKVPIGNGFSSVIIVDDRIYTQAKRGPNDGVVCFDSRDGKELWFVVAAPSYIDRQRQGPGPRSTPAYHQGKLYCLFPMGELLCLTTDGKKVWQANMFRDTGARIPAGENFYWGVSMSPLVEGDLVIVQPGGTNGNSVAAYHKETGKLVWTAGSDPIGYASPITISVTGKKQLIVPTGQSVLGIQPATGQVMWRYEFGNQFNATCASPVWAENLLFVSAAYGAKRRRGHRSARGGQEGLDSPHPVEEQEGHAKPDGHQHGHRWPCLRLQRRFVGFLSPLRGFVHRSGQVAAACR
jgi:outer membrane protein assembly factor BamB